MIRSTGFDQNLPVFTLLNQVEDLFSEKFKTLNFFNIFVKFLSFMFLVANCSTRIDFFSQIHNILFFGYFLLY